MAAAQNCLRRRKKLNARERLITTQFSEGNFIDDTAALGTNNLQDP